MKSNDKLTVKIALMSAMLALPIYVNAGTDQDMEDKVEHAKAEVREESEDFQDAAKDAWREGKLESAFLFNRHLNNFTIDVEVEGSTATLAGKVDSAVDKELAEQVALSIDGIERVDNDLEIGHSRDDHRDEKSEDREFSDKVEDATLTAEVKLKLLANSETEGMSINVDTLNRAVTLSGEVDSAAEKALAEQIASNVNGVKRVNNELSVANS